MPTRLHQFTLTCLVLAVGIMLTVALARAATMDNPVGTWLTANGQGVVAIEPCGEAVCGRIVGIDRAPGDPMPTDINGRPQCGLTIITNETPAGDGTWFGRVTDPRDGRSYRAKLWLDQDGNLHLRGFLGIPLLGATQVWHRFTGRLTAECALA